MSSWHSSIFICLSYFYFYFIFFWWGIAKTESNWNEQRNEIHLQFSIFFCLLTIQDVDTFSYFINRKLFRCIHTTSLEQQQQRRITCRCNSLPVGWLSVGCCWLDFLYSNSIINRLIDRIVVFLWNIKKEEEEKKQQQQTIRKLSESKEAESIRFEKCWNSSHFQWAPAPIYLAHKLDRAAAAARIVLHTHTHIVTHSSRSRSTLYILYNTIPAGGWSKKREKRENSSHSFVYTPAPEWEV